MPRRALRKLNLTDLYVRKLRPEAAAFVVWDTRQHGLALRVQPTGNRAWKAIYSRHGRPRWLHLGNADTIGLADARVLAAAAMLAVARGKDPAAEKKAERGKGTFEELATRYVEEHITSPGGRLTPSCAVTRCPVGASCKRRRSPVLTSRQ